MSESKFKFQPGDKVRCIMTDGFAETGDVVMVESYDLVHGGPVGYFAPVETTHIGADRLDRHMLQDSRFELVEAATPKIETRCGDAIDPADVAEDLAAHVHAINSNLGRVVTRLPGDYCAKPNFVAQVASDEIVRYLDGEPTAIVSESEHLVRGNEHLRLALLHYALREHAAKIEAERVPNISEAALMRHAPLH